MVVYRYTDTATVDATTPLRKASYCIECTYSGLEEDAKKKNLNNAKFVLCNCIRKWQRHQTNFTCCIFTFCRPYGGKYAMAEGGHAKVQAS